jgi:transposase
LGRKELTLEERAALVTRLDADCLSVEDRDTIKAILEYGLASKSLLLSRQASETAKERKRLERLQKKKKRGGQKAPGHGCIGNQAYTGARDVAVPGKYKAGDRCPGCDRGKLRPFVVKNLLTLIAQSPVDAIRYLVQQYRCSSCNKLYEDPPKEARWGKHHPSANAGVILARYGLGVPGYRLATWQKYMGIPLPDATQWDMVQKGGNCLKPIVEVLEELLAQKPILSTDDTGMKVLDLLEEFRSVSKKERHGSHGTCIHGKHKGWPIALYYFGRLHAGENMGRLLDKRDPTLGQPLQMGDGSANNLKHQYDTIEAYCNAHSFRKFRDVEATFPKEVSHILSQLGIVFKNDKKTREMDDMQRMRFHQEHSGPVLGHLHVYLDSLFEKKIVEPNAALGEAIRYMTKRWQGFTQFLRVPGAPVDNNCTERFLKSAIRYRKNSGFFKTEKSARLGAIIMSILATATACGANPMEYLIATQIHESDVRNNPHLWLPWNYTDRMALLDAA